MKLSLQKLQKILKLEADNGYENNAVIGGLDRLLDFWVPEARADGLPEDLIQVVSGRMRDYPRLAKPSRAETLQGLMRRLRRSEEPDLPPPPVEPSPLPEKRPARSTTRSKWQERERRQLPQAEDVKPQPDAYQANEPAPAVENRMPVVGTSLNPVEVAPVPSRQSALPVYSGPPAALNAPVTVLSGVGPGYARLLNGLGIQTLGDLLYYFPRRYDDYSQLKPINRLWYGDEVTVIAMVQEVNVRPIRNKKLKLIEAVVSDGTGSLRVTWFNKDALAKRLSKGTQIVLSGKVDQYLGRLVMNNPEMEALDQQQLHTNRIVPVYPLTEGLSQRWLRRWMNQVVSYWTPRVKDPLPVTLRASAGIMELGSALMQAHFPDTHNDLLAARYRLAFDEILLLQLGVLRQKYSWQERTARVFSVTDEWLVERKTNLPFALTGAQERAIEDVRRDLAAGHPMNRLLQGDVGSGKTMVAAMAMAVVVENAAQAAIMAPTSILAEQHYKNLMRLAADSSESEPHSKCLPILTSEICLLVGATPEAEKRQIRQALESGTLKVVVGTHALLEEAVVFKDLQLVVIDEQHRFGVEQRAVLRSKGRDPHLLVMTATPIPRSLALTVYGDLDLTVMDELPPGRQPVETHVLTPRERERAYALIRKQIQNGRQAFIIYPLVEESEKSDGKAAVDEHALLQSRIFADLRLGLLHGRMAADEKDEVMRRFRDGEYHILVSTSVVEVGVDVPNATVMLIEGANHFGLSQLHQFRGRVGRGAGQSYCLLIPDSPDAVENERLQVMSETNDGFILAERDLEQRGPGQFLGTRQSGYSELKLASLTNVHLIENARRHAQILFDQDSQLDRPENQFIAEALKRFWRMGPGDIS